MYNHKLVTMRFILFEQALGVFVKHGLKIGKYKILFYQFS